MKPFNKEWWYRNVLEACFYRYNPLHIGDNDARLERIRDFSIKRYAEAYHREKMKEERDRIIEILKKELDGNYLANTEGIIRKIKGG